MKTYNVLEIAEIFKVNDETVRRWIRSGKLHSTMLSKKEGNVISEEELFRFAQARLKYRTLLNMVIPETENVYNKELEEELKALLILQFQIDERIREVQNLLKDSRP